MTDAEQSKRMRAMRAVVAEFNAYRWGGEMLEDATRLRTNSTRRRQDHGPRWQPDMLHAVS
jgi:trehalose-6-phosphate synthase